MPGGAFGAFVSSLFVPVFGVAGGNVIMLLLGLIGLLLATEFLCVHGVKALRAGTIISLRSALIVTEAVRLMVTSQTTEAKERRKGKPGALTELRAPIFEEKVVDFIVELAKVTEKKVSREELFRTDEDEPKAA